LELVASLIFLGVAFTWVPTAITSTFAQVWQPLLYGTAVLGSIALFIISFGTLAAKTETIFAQAGTCAAVATGFALVILSYGTMLPMIASLIGFIIGFAGSGLAHLTK
jgi:hypothetical protein